LENKLLLHYLNHFNYEDYVGGTTRLKLTQQNLKKIPILLPPFPEQNRIVDKLDAIFGHLEQLKTKLDKIPGLLKNFRQALLNQAVTGKLTEEWREGKELEDMELILPEIRKGLIRELKNQNKRIKTNDSPLDGDLPKISKSWTWARLLDFSDVIGGVTKGRKLKDKKTVFVPYLRVANVQDGYLDLEEIKEIEVLPTDIKKYELKEKDILFTEGGDRDKLGRGTIWQNQIQGCIHQNHVYRARIYSNQIIPEYVSYFTKGIVAKTYFFENANQTVNLASINLTTLSNVPIAIPPTAEQQKIVENIKSLFNKADKIEQQYQTLKEKIDQLPQAILAKAFKGELVEQVPTDGDAKELLKQIQKAKAELGKTGKTKPKRGNTRKIPDIEERMAAEPKGRYRK
jgi:type I restriction enzyme S subunit